MIEWIRNVLAYDFMRNALLAALLVSLACGAIGTLVVLNRIVMISGGIAHAAYGGVGLAYFFGFNPVLGAIGFGLISSVGMGLTQRKLHERADTVIGVLWAIGMAIGIIFVSLSPGYKADLMSYLFGSILAVSALDLWLMLAVAVLAILFIWLFYRPLQAISFDETFAAVRNRAVSGHDCGGGVGGCYQYAGGGADPGDCLSDHSTSHCKYVLQTDMGNHAACGWVRPWFQYFWIAAFV
jgi:zinc transport system permease protein